MFLHLSRHHKCDLQCEARGTVKPTNRALPGIPLCFRLAKEEEEKRLAEERAAAILAAEHAEAEQLGLADDQVGTC